MSVYLNPHHELDRDVAIGVTRSFAAAHIPSQSPRAMTLLHVDPFSASGIRSQRVLADEALRRAGIRVLAVAGDIDERAARATVATLERTLRAGGAGGASGHFRGLVEAGAVRNVLKRCAGDTGNAALAVCGDASTLLAAVESAIIASAAAVAAPFAALVIDLDPFGSVAPHLPAALALAATAARRGIPTLLGVATFDVDQLRKCGGGTQWAKLGGAVWRAGTGEAAERAAAAGNGYPRPVRPAAACWSELALRMIVGVMATKLRALGEEGRIDDESRCPRSRVVQLRPLLCASFGKAFALRAWVEVRAELTVQGRPLQRSCTGAALRCAACGERSWHELDVALRCPRCGAEAAVADGSVARPLWRACASPRPSGKDAAAADVFDSEVNDLWEPMCDATTLATLAVLASDGAKQQPRSAVRATPTPQREHAVLLNLVDELRREAIDLAEASRVPPQLQLLLRPQVEAKASAEPSKSASSARERGEVGFRRVRVRRPLPLRWSIRELRRPFEVEQQHGAVSHPSTGLISRAPGRRCADGVRRALRAFGYGCVQCEHGRSVRTSAPLALLRFVIYRSGGDATPAPPAPSVEPTATAPAAVEIEAEFKLNGRRFPPRTMLAHVVARARAGDTITIVPPAAALVSRSSTATARRLTVVTLNATLCIRTPRLTLAATLGIVRPRITFALAPEQPRSRGSAAARPRSALRVTASAVDFRLVGVDVELAIAVAFDTGAGAEARERGPGRGGNGFAHALTVEAPGCSISECAFVSRSGAALAVVGCGVASLYRSTVRRGSSGAGLFVNGVRAVLKASRCTVVGCGGAGLEVRGGGSATLLDCDVEGSAKCAVFAQDGAQCSLLRCALRRSGWSSVEAGGGGTLVTLERCRLLSAQRGGVLAHGGASVALRAECVIDGAGLAGVDVRGRAAVRLAPRVAARIANCGRSALYAHGHGRLEVEVESEAERARWEGKRESAVPIIGVGGGAVEVDESTGGSLVAYLVATPDAEVRAMQPRSVAIKRKRRGSRQANVAAAVRT